MVPVSISWFSSTYPEPPFTSRCFQFRSWNIKSPVTLVTGDLCMVCDKRTTEQARLLLVQRKFICFETLVEAGTYLYMREDKGG